MKRELFLRTKEIFRTTPKYHTMGCALAAFELDVAESSIVNWRREFKISTPRDMSKLTGRPQYSQRQKKVFKLIRQWGRDPDLGAYLEALT